MAQRLLTCFTGTAAVLIATCSFAQNAKTPAEAAIPKSERIVAKQDSPAMTPAPGQKITPTQEINPIDENGVPLTTNEAATIGEPQKDYVILDLNGEKIYYSEVQEIWDGLFPGDGPAPSLESFGPAVKDNIIRGIVSERLMLKEAERIDLADKPEVQQRLHAIRRQVLVQQLLKERNDDILTDANVKKAYEDIVRRNAGKEEVRARHILVESKKEAEDIYKQLENKKADFAKIAKEKSIDKGTAERGGDLGYFKQSDMVPEFSKAAYALDKGEISKPVESPFGWHIIEVEDRRQLPIPTLAEARPDIEKKLIVESNQSYVENLLKEAKVTYYSPSGEKLPFPQEAQVTDKLTEE